MPGDRGDIVSRIRPLDTLKVAESFFAKVVKSKDLKWLYGGFNQRKKNSKWRDIRLRRALNYAINREELWKSAAKGNAYNLGGLIPQGVYGHNPDIDPFSYDTYMAKALIADAGYANGLEIKVIAPEELGLETQIMARMFERIGVKTNFQVLSTPEFWRKTVIPFLDKPAEKQDWDIYLDVRDAWTGRTGLDLLVDCLDVSNRRWIEYDAVYEEMWTDMLRTVDNAAREEKIRHLIEHIYENAYILFIYSPMTLYAVNKEIDFVPYQDGLLNLKETAVTDRHWSLRGKNNEVDK